MCLGMGLRCVGVRDEVSMGGTRVGLYIARSFISNLNTLARRTGSNPQLTPQARLERSILQLTPHLGQRSLNLHLQLAP